MHYINNLCNFSIAKSKNIREREKKQMSLSDILSIISIILTIFFGIAGLIAAGVIINKLSANSKIGNHSNNNIVNQNINNNNEN